MTSHWIEFIINFAFFSLFFSPDVTRSPRPGEVDGRDYHFISREDMEKGVQDGRFLDYMETRGQLHGVAISSVKDVIDEGKLPIMDLLPQVKHASTVATGNSLVSLKSILFLLPYPLLVISF